MFNIILIGLLLVGLFGFVWSIRYWYYKRYLFLHSGLKKGNIIMVNGKKYPINNGEYKIKKVKKDRLILE